MFHACRGTTLALVANVAVFPGSGPAEDGLPGSGRQAGPGLRLADHGGGGGVPVEGAGREAGSSVQAADGGVRGSASGQEWPAGQRGERPEEPVEVLRGTFASSRAQLNALRSPPSSVHVEAGLRLPPDLGRPHWRQLPRRHPGASRGPRQDEEPYHQEVEASDGHLDPGQLPGQPPKLRLLPRRLRGFCCVSVGARLERRTSGLLKVL